MTASVIVSPSFASASCFNFCKIIADTSSGRYHLGSFDPPGAAPICTSIPPLEDFLTSNGTAFLSLSTAGSSYECPMKRFIWNTVFLGFVTACLLAKSPTSRSPVFETATTDGVVRAPSAFSIISGSPLRTTATAEFVVPKSIPILFPMMFYSILYARQSQPVPAELYCPEYDTRAARLLQHCPVCLPHQLPAPPRAISGQNHLRFPRKRLRLDWKVR